MCSAAEILNSEREAMEYDVCIVGGGPAGLAAAIRLRQLAIEHEKEISVCIVEKGGEVGAHILSGNVFETKALDELIPDWKELGAPLNTPVTTDAVRFLTESSSIWLPVPPAMHNHGNYIISLGQLCGWLGGQAEELGVDVFPGFAASEVVYDKANAVKGIATRDMGIDKEGAPKDSFERGMEIHAKQTLFAEGARGSCSETIMKNFNLREGCDPQTYGLGLKEVWQIPEEKHEPGKCVHTLGWPLDSSTYGGSFLYHMLGDEGEPLVLTGFVAGLDYGNPYLSPYQEFQRWKTHPSVKEVLEGGECVSYGARVINEGGYQSIPKLTFPGGALIGCSAGFVNVPKVKGSHTAMKSGIVAAESIFETVSAGGLAMEEGLDPETARVEVTAFQTNMEGSWVFEELKAVRNIHPIFKNGLWLGMLYSGIESFVLRGKGWWTFRNTKTDSEKTKKASECTPIDYPKPDGVLTFDILSNLQRSSVNHEHDQPAHLRVKEELKDSPVNVSYKEYAAPETRFCPAKVYEYSGTEEGGTPQLVINAQNCVHCKCCSIKMPQEYIDWTVPEGGGGPAYMGM